MSTVLSVLLVDDDTELLDSLGVLVNASSQLTLAGCATRTKDAVRLSAQRSPDVVLADIRMPGPDGLTLTRTLTGGHRPSRPAVLVTTAFPLDEYVLAALGGGANGFLPKGAPWSDVESALLAVAAGQIVLPSALISRLVELTLPGRPRLSDLSERELQILALVGAGYDQSAMARQLNLSTGTVRAHLEHLRTKLGAHSRAELTIAAKNSGLIVPRRQADIGSQAGL